MNRLTLHRTTAARTAVAGIDAVEIEIDGVSLLDLVRTFELPFARDEGDPDRAGQYAWLDTPDTVRALHAESTRWADRTAVMECHCGTPGCWPLEMHVIVTDDTVTWERFRQPHRSGSSGGRSWDLGGLGPFVFERQQYDDAVRGLGAHFDAPEVTDAPPWRR